MLDQLRQWTRRLARASQSTRHSTRHSAHLGDRLAELPAPLTLSEVNEFDTVRLVVLDLETSGLNTNRDLVLAIGAVAIEHGCIPFDDQFETVLRQPELKQDDTVLIHGLGPETLARGVPSPDGLVDFLCWAGPAVFIAFHAPFDQRMLERALKAHLGIRPTYTWLDMADILPALFPDAKVGPGRLDNWLHHFQLDVSNRHNAAADAMVTAELMLIAIHQARAQAITTLPELAEKARLLRRLKNNRQGF